MRRSLAEGGRGVRLMDRAKEAFSSRRGAVAVLVGLGLSVLFGFGALVMDLGRVYGVRLKLQDAADAAALAGVSRSDPARAQEAALEILRQNGIEETGGDVVEVDVEENQGGQTERVRVLVRRSVPYFLARVLGVEGAEVSARAVARLGGVDEVRGKRSPEAGGEDPECDRKEGEERERCEEADDDLEGKLVPLAVREDSWVPGQRVEIRPRRSERGNYYSLALGGGGGNRYRDNLKYGYEGRLKTGDVIDTEPGCMWGPTREAIRYRLDRDPEATYENFTLTSPRLIYVAMVDGELHGRDQVQVKGFAAFFLEGFDEEQVQGEGKCPVLIGRFVRVVARGQPGAPYDYGLEVPVLEE